VEVTLAIGIIAFAFVAILGLMPVGLSTFRKSMDTSINSQIVQRLINEAQQTDYPKLVATPTSPLRYFDDQGNEVSGGDSYIYVAEVSVVAPTALPNTSTPPTSSLATVVVRLANNPGHRASPFSDDSRVPYATFTALIAKNQ
jgi:uncharacterized protein (TIGR02598 family)